MQLAPKTRRRFPHQIPGFEKPIALPQHGCTLSKRDLPDHLLAFDAVEAFIQDREKLGGVRVYRASLPRAEVRASPTLGEDRFGSDPQVFELVSAHVASDTQPLAPVLYPRVNFDREVSQTQERPKRSQHRPRAHGIPSQAREGFPRFSSQISCPLRATPACPTQGHRITGDAAGPRTGAHKKQLGKGRSIGRYRAV